MNSLPHRAPQQRFGEQPYFRDSRIIFQFLPQQGKATAVKLTNNKVSIVQKRLPCMYQHKFLHDSVVVALFQPTVMQEAGHAYNGINRENI
jgi:hypothetical protein